MQLSRWQKLMQAFHVDHNEKIYEQLVSYYSQRHRYYHTAKHVEACLNHLDPIHHLTDKPHEIEMALWFHDAIYKPYSSTNELDSANWAKRFLLDNKVDQVICERIYHLVMVTLHNGKANTTDEKLMIDIDLTILGSLPAIYQIFEKNVRKEYRLVPYFLYRKKRKHILQGFLDQKQIYQTEYFRQLFEKQARENIQKVLQNL
jgi:predicted metal-dependent HD superfamily phosphohydrolase